MRSLFVPRVACVAALLLAAGCSSSNKGKIEGTKWTSLAATMKGQPLPAGILQLTFGKDGSVVYKAGPQTFTGTYSLGQGANVILDLSSDLTARDTHLEKIVINGDQLTMTDSDGTQLTFQQVN